MKTVSKRSFNSRAFVALTAAFSGFGLPITGTVNHLLHPEPMTVSQHAWTAAHNGLGILFVTFAVWHAILNRRLLVNHVRGSAGRLPGVSGEAIFAALLAGAAVFLAVGHAFHLR